MKLNPKHYWRLWREPWRKVFWRSFYAFRRENGEDRRRDLGFLTPEDTVFDFGGFEGAWAAFVHEGHGCAVHVFEPHPVFAAGIAERFSQQDRVVCHDFALGSQDGSLQLSDASDASSAITGGNVRGKIVAARAFLDGIAAPVALAKINIEGGEYSLLPALDEADWLRHIQVIQVQFHLYSEEDIARREAIRTTLAKTHVCDWDYPFVWEQWSLKPAA